MRCSCIASSVPATRPDLNMTFSSMIFGLEYLNDVQIQVATSSR